MTPAQQAWLRQMPLSRDHPNRIRIAMALRGWAVVDLMARTGLSRWKIERIMSGFTERLRPQEAQAIASALELTIDEVFADRPYQDVSFPELPP